MKQLHLWRFRRLSLLALLSINNNGVALCCRTVQVGWGAWWFDWVFIYRFSSDEVYLKSDNLVELSRHMNCGLLQNQAPPCTGFGTLSNAPNTCSRSLKISSMAGCFSIQTNFVQRLVCLRSSLLLSYYFLIISLHILRWLKLSISSYERQSCILQPRDLYVRILTLP